MQKIYFSLLICLLAAGMPPLLGLTYTDIFDDSDPAQVSSLNRTIGISFGGSGNGTASFTASGSLADINAALDAATFTPTPNLYGTNAGTISFVSNDGTTHSNTASVTFDITPVNDEPTDLLLDNTSVVENEPIGTVVGLFSAIGGDTGDTYTYTLVFGSGDGGNSSFSISGNELRTAAVFDFDTQNFYSIRVRVTDSDGLTFEKTFTITVDEFNEEPTDILLDNSSVAENKAIGTTVGTFSAVDPDADDSFVYTFVAGAGDDNNSSFTIAGDALQTAAEFDFETKNTYSIRVRVTDAGGLGFEEQFAITVANVNEAPSGYAVTWDDLLINAIESSNTSFTISNSELGATVNYSISSNGDGNTATITGSLPVSSVTQQIPVDVSTLADGILTIEITLTVEGDNEGEVVSANNATLAQTAPASPSTPDLTDGSDTGISNTDNITADNTPTFTGTAEAFTSVEVFSDGSTLGITSTDGAGIWSLTTFALTDGTYAITAIAINAAGNVSLPSAVLSITIDQNECIAQADFNLSPSEGCASPLTVFFTDQSTSPDIWAWDFGDGASSSAQNPIHSYTSYGDFTVKLTVSDTIYGCSSSIEKVISNYELSPEFTSNGAFGCGPLTVDFDDLSVGAVSWDWDFGDGNTSTEQNPSHTYEQPGTYTVALTTGGGSCSKTLTKTNYIQVIGPKVDFSQDITEGCGPLTVSFTSNTFSGSPQTGWVWDFGDGATSTLQNPTHEYASVGTYTVTLTVSDLDGCSRMVTKPDLIQVNELEASIVPIHVTCNGGSDGSITALPDEGLAPFTFQWNNGVSTATISALSAGIYSVIITDTNGCSVTKSVELTEPIPAALTTSNPSLVNHSSAELGGELLNGLDCAQETGIVYATTSNPNISDSKVAMTLTANLFSEVVTGLEINTTYYVRAYSTNQNGVTTYGNEGTFTTLKKTLDITADAGQSKVYGETDPAFTYTVTGFENGDDESILSGELIRVTGEDVGIYAIQLGTLSAGANYTINFSSADFTIISKSIVDVTIPEEINVSCSTPFEDLDLPSKIEVTYENGTTEEIPVSWNEDDYDPLIGNHTLTGTLEFPDYVEMTENLTAMIMVIVGYATDPEIPDIVPVADFLKGARSGDTIHLVDCIFPDATSRDISWADHRDANVKSRIYSYDLPDEPPFGMFKLLNYNYEIEDQCSNKSEFDVLLGLYDLNGPTFQYFPRDIRVSSPQELPEVNPNVKILDICTYVVWDTVITTPLIHPVTKDTTAFVRRWSARDLVGHQTYRDQLIHIGPDHMEYGGIHARIAYRDSMDRVRFSGEIGSNHLKFSLYRMDEMTDTMVLVDTTLSQNWFGQQGKVHFQPLFPGRYQVKIAVPEGFTANPDTLISYEGWSDTLTVADDTILDLGLIILVPIDTLKDSIINDFSFPEIVKSKEYLKSKDELEWKVYPNPSAGKIRFDLPVQNEFEFTIFNRSGKIIKNGLISHGGSLSLDSLQDGLYFVRIRREDGVMEHKKLIIMK